MLRPVSAMELMLAALVRIDWALHAQPESSPSPAPGDLMVFYVGRHRAQQHSHLRRPGTLGAAAVAAAGLALPASWASATSSAPAVSAAPAATAAVAAATRPTQSPPSTGAVFRGVVRIGHRGPLVRQIQRKVGASADGVFGPRTRAKVMAYQRRHGLVADGIVGPRTGTRMGLAGTPAPTRATRSTTRTTATRTTTTRTTATRSGIVRTARSLVGSRYIWGGATPAGFDCSGFTSYVYGRNGRTIPRTAEAQRRAARTVGTPAPGDLVFFGYPAHHVGIYTGSGRMVDAGNPRRGVSERAIWAGTVSYGRF